jgi:hypothetical protein
MAQDVTENVALSELKRGSILLDITVSPFSVKRRSNPSGAFAEMMHRFAVAVREDDDMARAFASFQARFKGVVLEQEDAVRLAELEARGAGDLKIEIGTWPSAMGPGIAYMYDAALETLRSTDHPIEPELIGAKAIRAVERSLDSVLPLLGSMSVKALELALDDKRFSDQLRQRATEVGTAYLDNPIGPCTNCIFEIKDHNGNVINTVCGTKDECDSIIGWIIIALTLLLLGKLIDWLTS